MDRDPGHAGEALGHPDEGRTRSRRRTRPWSSEGWCTSDCMNVLRIATSPRSTWITAPDEDSARAIRGLLDGHFDAVRRQGQIDAHAIDACTGLRRARRGQCSVVQRAAKGTQATRIDGR